MLPNNQLSTITKAANFLVPETQDLVDYEFGGVALNDPSEGLQFQIWTATYDGDFIIVTPENGSPINILEVAGVTELSLAFDQNMRPNLTYVADDIAYLYWFDTLALGMVTTEIGEGVTNPKISLDDARPTQTADSDIILAYLRNDELFMRVQRERYTVEYPLTSVTEGAKLLQIGMTDAYRFQFKTSK